MNIDTLKLFYNVAEANSISVVAKQNHISQSALSQQLFKLEEKLDVKLFNRSNKGVTLTKEGEVVLKHCKSIFRSSELLFQELDSLKKNKEVITIKSPEVLNSTLISSALMDIRKRYSKLTINLFNSQHNVDELDTNVADEIVFSYIEKGNTSEVMCEKLFDDELILISKSSQDKENILIKDLPSIPIIAVEDLISAHKLVQNKVNELLSSSKKLNIVLTTESYSPAIFSLANSKYYLFVPKSTFIIHYKDLGFKQIQIDDFSIPLSVYITFNESLIKTEKRFISALKKSILNKLSLN
ncbi:MAG: LysR family transcriptional regulator [Clostridium sp.]